MNYLYEHVYNFVCQCNIFVERFTNDNNSPTKLLISFCMLQYQRWSWLQIYWLIVSLCMLTAPLQVLFYLMFSSFLVNSMHLFVIEFHFCPSFPFHSIENCISTSKIAYLINYFSIFQFILKPFLIPSLKIEIVSYYWLINQITNHVVCWKQHS